MSRKKEVLSNKNTVQAVLVVNTFGDEFVPISNDIPLCLFPMLNKPIIDYTLEFLSLGGVEETFLFCCNHAEAIKAYIKKCLERVVGWTLTMKVNIIVSENCYSFGDCLRDLYGKSLLRDDFVLLEPMVISNISLLPLLKKHRETRQIDGGAAMTLLYQECGLGHKSLCPEDETLIGFDAKNRVLFHQKTYKIADRKIKFPMEIFLENPNVCLRHNVKDTHISICSLAVLSLFSDNFDFQTKDDFIRGLLMNEEIMGSTVYCEILRGSDYGGAAHNWRTFQSISMELKDKWIYPLGPSIKKNKYVQENSVAATNAKISQTVKLCRSVVGTRVKIGKNVNIQDSFIFDDVVIEDDAVVFLSIIGPNCVVKKGAKIINGCILGKGVVIGEGVSLENQLIQATEPDFAQPDDKIGESAYKVCLEENEDDIILDKNLANETSRLYIYGNNYESVDENEDGFSDAESTLSRSLSIIPADDTKMFFSEVIDSLTRGFEDKLPCDNLILEINSSRYAYNVTVREVNFNVIRAILIMSQDLPDGAQYFSSFAQMLLYFGPILKNYIKNDTAMEDCLQAVEDVAISTENLRDKWTVFVLKCLYEKDYLTEEAILSWFSKIESGTRLRTDVKPFADWLKEAEEESD